MSAGSLRSGPTRLILSLILSSVSQWSRRPGTKPPLTPTARSIGSASAPMPFGYLTKVDCPISDRWPMHKAGDERRQRSGRATTPGRRRAFSRIHHGRLVVRTRQRVGLRGGRRGRTADHARAVLSLSPAPTRTDGRRTPRRPCFGSTSGGSDRVPLAGLTQSFPVRPRRLRLPWRMRAPVPMYRCTKWVLGCHLGRGTWRHPRRRRGLRRARDRCARLVSLSASSLAQRPCPALLGLSAMPRVSARPGYDTAHEGGTASPGTATNGRPRPKTLFTRGSCATHVPPIVIVWHPGTVTAEAARAVVADRPTPRPTYQRPPPCDLMILSEPGDFQSGLADLCAKTAAAARSKRSRIRVRRTRRVV